MKINVVQMKSYAGQFKKNFDFMVSEIENTKGKADIIVFPELCISGSLVMNYFKETSVVNELLSYNQKIIELSDDLMIIWGNVDRHFDELLDAGFVAYQGELLFQNDKMFNSTSNFKDKKQYFTHIHKKKLKTFKAFNKTMSVVINNDIMVHDYDKVDLLFHLNAHYYRHKDQLQRKVQFIENLDCDVVSVNGVGIINNGKYIGLLDGQSIVKHQEMTHILNSKFESESKIVNLKKMESNVNGQTISLLDALLFGIKQVDEEIFSFKPKWVIGLSGGLDSSVTASLLTLALGSDRILGVNLATRFNSDTTKNNAAHLAHKLNIEYRAHSIEPLVSSTQEVISQQSDKQVEGLNLENAQARLRGHVLMTMASLENGVVSNNTNKIESALGYGTMYGDTIGALGILADCTKMDIIDIARAINERQQDEIVPINLLPELGVDGLQWDFAPSAELSSGQKDPMKWGYHDYLIERLISEPNAKIDILRDYLDGSLIASPIGVYLRAYNLNDSNNFVDDYLWILKNMNRNVFKRIQSVPVIVVSHCVLGLDYLENQMPLVITDEMNQLMEEIRKS